MSDVNSTHVPSWNSQQRGDFPLSQTIARKLARALMKLGEVYPPLPDDNEGERKGFRHDKVGELQEVFRHDSFLKAEPARQDDIMLESSRSKYGSEMNYAWDHYFGIDLRAQLKGKEALDLGCFNGGRSVAWFERYGLKRLWGIDVDPVYIEAANQFAALKNVPATFRLGVGETLPLDDRSVDAILSFDVFEHVRNVAQTLGECYRVLRPGGRCYLVFPSYFQPIEHHLSLVTRVPGIQCLFTGRTLVRAYCDILDERGREAYWYKRASPELEPWERGNTLNGITFRKFKRIVGEGGWRIILEGHKPMGSIGRISRTTNFCTCSHGRSLRLPISPGFKSVFFTASRSFWRSRMCS